MVQRDQNHNLARNLNGLDIRLLRLHLRDCHSEDTILHCSLDLIHLSILRKPKPPQELATATLHSMPRVFLLFLLHFPLSAYLEHSIIFNFNLHFLFVEPRKISFEHMGFWGLLPIHTDENGKSLNGSQISSENGSSMLLRWLPKKLGIRDILIKSSSTKKTFEVLTMTLTNSDWFGKKECGSEFIGSWGFFSIKFIPKAQQWCQKKIPLRRFCHKADRMILG
ncbi:hypothetical protein CFP56_010428 [Quercus suber]|uniref:Uncharacterized protein n=1 Tax=Quercus suber TaxID=58331 RepID=A0AAW0M5C4_QUESU